MRRLYQKIYLTIIASLVLVVMVAGALWRLGAESTPAAQAFEMAGELRPPCCCPPNAPRAAQQAAVDRVAPRLTSTSHLFDPARELIASAGRPLPRRCAMPADGSTDRRGRPGPCPLPDDRWLVVRALAAPPRPVVGLLLALGGIALAVAVARLSGGARPDPAAGAPADRRRDARRRQSRGPRQGRRPRRGRAACAEASTARPRASRNWWTPIACCSPRLARIAHAAVAHAARGRAATQKTGTRNSRTEIEHDIVELDQLVDEILLASRLERSAGAAGGRGGRPAGAARRGGRALRRLRLDGDAGACARRCAAAAAVDPQPHRQCAAPRRAADRGRVRRRERGGFILDVIDAGPGIPEAERERVFSPFHRLSDDNAGTGLGLSLWCGRSHGCTAATPWWRRARRGRAASG